MREKKGKEIAFRPAFLVNAKYRITRKEDDIVNILLSCFTPGIEEYVINLNLFASSYKIKKMGRNYGYIQEAVEMLKSRIVEFEFDNTNYKTKWVSKIDYISDDEYNSRIYIRVDPVLYKFLNKENLQGVYYKTFHSNNINSDLGRRLFYSLQMFLGTSSETWKKEKVEKLKEISMIETRNSHFIVLLKKAVSEINTSSNFFLDYKEEYEKTKSGQKKLDRICFHITQKTESDKENFNKRKMSV